MKFTILYATFLVASLTLFGAIPPTTRARFREISTPRPTAHSPAPTFTKGAATGTLLAHVTLPVAIAASTTPAPTRVPFRKLLRFNDRKCRSCSRNPQTTRRPVSAAEKRNKDADDHVDEENDDETPHDDDGGFDEGFPLEPRHLIGPFVPWISCLVFCCVD